MIAFFIGTCICYVLFLFFLYRLGKEDYILIRKGVALEQLFTLTFQTTIVGLVTGRLVYVLFHFDTTFLNPLKFIVVLYFPGVIFSALLIGGFLYIWYISRLQRLPAGRLIDFYAIAVSAIMPLLTVLQLLLPGTHVVVQLSIAGFFIFIFFLFRFFLLPRVGRGEIKNGTIGILYIGVLSTMYFLQDAFIHTRGFFSFLQGEDIVYLASLCVVIILIYMSEFKQVKKRKQKMI